LFRPNIAAGLPKDGESKTEIVNLSFLNKADEGSEALVSERTMRNNRGLKPAFRIRGLVGLAPTSSTEVYIDALLAGSVSEY